MWIQALADKWCFNVKGVRTVMDNHKKERGKKSVSEKKVGQWAHRRIEENFELVLGLYFIGYIYWNTKRHSSLLEYKEDSIICIPPSIYGILNMSRHKFYRIMHGNNFRLSQANIEELQKIFNIGFCYFELTEKKTILNCNKEMWMKYIAQKYKWPEHEQGTFTEEQKQVVGRLKEMMEELNDESLELENKIKYGDLFKIDYYFRNGKTYVGGINRDWVVNALEKVKITEWEEIQDFEKLECYRDVFFKHYKYIECILIKEKLRMEDE